MKKVSELKVAERFVDPDFGVLEVTGAPTIRGACVDIEVDGAPSHYHIDDKVRVV